jgi:hypothetical protein
LPAINGSSFDPSVAALRDVAGDTVEVSNVLDPVLYPDISPVWVPPQPTMDTPNAAMTGPTNFFEALIPI